MSEYPIRKSKKIRRIGRQLTQKDIKISELDSTYNLTELDEVGELTALAEALLLEDEKRINHKTQSKTD